MEYLLLSYIIDENSPFYIGTTKPVITPNNQISRGSSYNTYLITIENHCGTHVDAPAHFSPTGRKISDYNLQELTFNHPLILDCPKDPGENITIDDLWEVQMDGVDCIFFRTGFGKYRDADVETYLSQNPGISAAAIHWLRKKYKSIRCLGIDSISISNYGNEERGIKTHLAAFNADNSLGKPLLLVEDLKLDNISPKDRVKSIIILPWQIGVIDSAPCTVLAVL